MGTVAAKLKDLFSNKKLELCLVGLENSGKTTLMNILATGYPVETLPTVGLNVKSVKKEGVALKVWDLGGQERFRGEWGRYAQGCDVIIFIVDSSDYGRIPTARKELHALLEDSRTRGMPLLCLLNKIDVEPHMSKAEIIKELNLEYILENDWVVLSASALRKTNIDDVVDWMVKHSKKKS